MVPLRLSIEFVDEDPQDLASCYARRNARLSQIRQGIRYTPYISAALVCVCGTTDPSIDVWTDRWSPVAMVI